MSTEFRDFERRLAGATSSQEAYAALEAFARSTVDFRLFTIMEVDLDSMVARRAYSNQPDAYPTSGTKPIVRNEWFAKVIDRRETFVANTLAEIAEVFPDHKLIGALGCGSVINLPVIDQGRVIATINILDREGAYSRDVVEMAEAELTHPSRLAILHVAGRRHVPSTDGRGRN